MKYRKEKLERLARVAHLYYEENKTQGEIADMLRVSRPLVSRMLNEARSIGIVEIRVHSFHVQRRNLCRSAVPNLRPAQQHCRAGRGIRGRHPITRWHCAC